MPLLNTDLSKPAYIRTSQQDFTTSPSPGVLRLMLDRDADEVARCTTIVKYLPDSAFPEHVHSGGEEFLVLSGHFHDEHGLYPRGTYIRNPIGSKHAPFVKDDGCVIFVKLRQMRQKEAQLTKKHVFEASQVLYEDENETVRIVNLQEGEKWSVAPYQSGEEIYVVKGSFVQSNDDLTDEYVQGDWVRRWQSHEQVVRVAGEEGACLWIKTGHITEEDVKGSQKRIGEYRRER